MVQNTQNLEEMTLRQLRRIASLYNISRYSRMRKSQLISAIRTLQPTPFNSPTVTNPHSSVTQTEVEAAKFEVGSSTSRLGADAPDTDALESPALVTQPLEAQGATSTLTELASVDAALPELPTGYGESQIVLMPRDPQWCYVYWDLPNAHKEAVRRQGGQNLALRIYDVTDINLSQQNPHNVQEYPCDELARDWYLPIPISDRDYFVEIGYRTADGRWLALAQSGVVRVPPVYPSDWIDDQFVTVSWDQPLMGASVHQLPHSNQESLEDEMRRRMRELEVAAEAKRQAGSLMRTHSPEETLSSYVFPSGVGRWASGVGMSGMGMQMSGAGMSGAGGQMSGMGMAASGAGMSGAGMMSGMGMEMSGAGMSGAGMSGAGMMSGMSMQQMSGAGMMSGMGMQQMSGAGMNMSGVGMQMSGAGMNMSGIGMSGMGMQQMSGAGMMSGMGMMSGAGMTMSGMGMMSGAGMTMSGVGMSGMGMQQMSGIGMQQMSGAGMMSGMGMQQMSGAGMMSGMGMQQMSGAGMNMSGVGMSGIGMQMSGVGMNMSGVGMSGMGMQQMSGAGMMSGMGMQQMSGAGMMSGMGMQMSGIGMNMSGVGMSGVGFSASAPPIRPRKFWLVADAELIVYGATEPDATVTIGGRPIKLNPDGTFRFQMSFQDGEIDYPIMAVAADGEQTRAIHMNFERETPSRQTNTKDEAQLEWLEE